jgi:hypothetical protein
MEYMVFNLIKMCPVYAPQGEKLSKAVYIRADTLNKYGKLFPILHPQKSHHTDLLYIYRNVTKVI